MKTFLSIATWLVDALLGILFLVELAWAWVKRMLRIN